MHNIEMMRILMTIILFCSVLAGTWAMLMLLHEVISIIGDWKGEDDYDDN